MKAQCLYFIAKLLDQTHISKSKLNPFNKNLDSNKLAKFSVLTEISDLEKFKVLYTRHR